MFTLSKYFPGIKAMFFPLIVNWTKCSHIHIWTHPSILLFPVHLPLTSSCMMGSAHELGVCSHCTQKLSGLFKPISRGCSVIAGWLLAFKAHTSELLWDEFHRFRVICSNSNCLSCKNANLPLWKRHNRNLPLTSNLKDTIWRDHRLFSTTDKKNTLYDPSGPQIWHFLSCKHEKTTTSM